MVLDFHFTLPNPNQVKFHIKMEEANECLLITSIEISCWKEQLKQTVSQSHTLIIFHAIQSLSVSILG